jgi:hypothetical protein
VPDDSRNSGDCKHHANITPDCSPACHDWKSRQQARVLRVMRLTSSFLQAESSANKLDRSFNINSANVHCSFSVQSTLFEDVPRSLACSATATTSYQSQQTTRSLHVCSLEVNSLNTPVEFNIYEFSPNFPQAHSTLQLRPSPNSMCTKSIASTACVAMLLAELWASILIFTNANLSSSLHQKKQV